MTSDPALVEAYRADCNLHGPGTAWVMWEGRPGIDPDDLITVAAKVDQNGRNAPAYLEGPAPPPYRLPYTRSPHSY